MSPKNGDSFTSFSFPPFLPPFLPSFLPVIIRPSNVTLIEIMGLDILPLSLILGGTWLVFHN